MSRYNLLIIAVVGLLVLNLGLLAFLFLNRENAPLHQSPSMHSEGPKQLIIDKLRLDATQIKMYEKLVDEHRNSIRQLNDDILRSRQDLYNTLSDKDSIGRYALITKLGELQKQVEEVNYKHFEDIRSLCKPSQVKYFEDLTKQLANLFAPRKNTPTPPKDRP